MTEPDRLSHPDKGESQISSSTSKKKSLRGMLGFKQKGGLGLGGKQESLFDNSKFKMLKSKILKQRKWMQSRAELLYM